MPSKPYQYKGELEGVVNTKQQTRSLRLNPSSNGACKKGLVLNQAFHLRDYFLMRQVLCDISLTSKMASSPLM
ncbi:hypothetical protein THOB06_230040 [Vibrio rotiferianus]|nr:hypothetical protein THOG10_230041 [Vibrio rotiferianus]CAH1577136.1 hypothetical protein THOB06_230040 [Vibrio rotiferianus]